MVAQKTGTVMANAGQAILDSAQASGKTMQVLLNLFAEHCSLNSQHLSDR